MVLWKRQRPTSLEHCSLIQGDGYFALAGRILTMLEGEPTFVQYGLRWVVDGSALGLGVTLRQGLNRKELRLERDDIGHWKRDGQVMAELDGILEPDLEISPSTNSLPIRRLDLEIGSSAETDTAWIRFPDLSIQRLQQRYTRTSENEYSYESGNGAFTANLRVDHEGLVMSYGDIWERVSS